LYNSIEKDQGFKRVRLRGLDGENYLQKRKGIVSVAMMENDLKRKIEGPSGRNVGGSRRNKVKNTVLQTARKSRKKLPGKEGQKKKNCFFQEAARRSEQIRGGQTNLVGHRR